MKINLRDLPTIFTSTIQILKCFNLLLEINGLSEGSSSTANFCFFSSNEYPQAYL